MKKLTSLRLVLTFVSFDEDITLNSSRLPFVKRSLTVMLTHSSFFRGRAGGGPGGVVANEDGFLHEASRRERDAAWLDTNLLGMMKMGACNYIGVRVGVLFYERVLRHCFMLYFLMASF